MFRRSFRTVGCLGIVLLVFVGCTNSDETGDADGADDDVIEDDQQSLSASSCAYLATPVNDGLDIDFQVRPSSVLLDLEITDEERDAIRDVLDAIYRGEVVYVDQAETYAELRELYADVPQALETIEPDDLPASFRIDVDPDEPRIEETEVPALAGVGSVISTDAQELVQRLAEVNHLDVLADVWDRPHDIRVFLATDATDDDLHDIEQFMSGHGEVGGVVVYDLDDSVAEFELLVGPLSDRVPSISPEDIPRSVRAFALAPGVAPGLNATLDSDHPAARDVTYKAVDHLRAAPSIGFEPLAAVEDDLTLDGDLSALVDLTVQWMTESQLGGLAEVHDLELLDEAQRMWSAIRESATEACQLTPQTVS